MLLMADGWCILLSEKSFLNEFSFKLMLFTAFTLSTMGIVFLRVLTFTNEVALVGLVTVLIL